VGGKPDVLFEHCNFYKWPFRSTLKLIFFQYVSGYKTDTVNDNFTYWIFKWITSLINISSFKVFFWFFQLKLLSLNFKLQIFFTVVEILASHLVVCCWKKDIGTSVAGVANSLTFSLSLSLSLSSHLTHSRTLSLPSLSLYHTHTLSLSLSLAANWPSIHLHLYCSFKNVSKNVLLLYFSLPLSPLSLSLSHTHFVYEGQKFVREQMMIKLVRRCPSFFPTKWKERTKFRNDKNLFHLQQKTGSSMASMVAILPFYSLLKQRFST